MTPQDSEAFAAALLDGLSELDEPATVTDEECAAVIGFARTGVAAARRVQLDIAKAERERVRTGSIETFVDVAVEVLRDRIRAFALAHPTLAVQHRDLEGMRREDLESLLSDMTSLDDKSTEDD